MFCFKMNETALKRKHNLKKASFSVHRTRRAFTVRVAKRREEEKKVLINTFITGRFMLFTLDGKLKWKTNCLLSAQDRRFMISTFPDVVDFIWLWMLFIRTKKNLFSFLIPYSLTKENVLRVIFLIPSCYWCNYCFSMSQESTIKINYALVRVSLLI